MLGLAVFGASNLASAIETAGTVITEADAAVMSDDEVCRIDKVMKKVTIKQGESESLDVPPMTMVFQVEEPALMEEVTVGDSIKFRLKKIGSKYTATTNQVAKQISFSQAVYMQRRNFLGAMGGLPALALASSISNAASPTVTSGKRIGRRVGVAFGGGSMHGIAHLGVLKAFAEKNVKIELIAGTSVGAIVGVLAAAQLPLNEIVAVTRNIEWPGLLSLSWSGRGLMQNNQLRLLIDKALGDRKIEQLPIPFGAVATDLANGKRVVIRKGPAGIAVDASSSIPVFFTPVKIDGRFLVDGGLTEPVPVIAVREMGADIVIGIDVSFRPKEEQVRGLSGVAFQTMHIMANALIREQIGRADVAITMNLHQFIGNDNTHEQLIEAGYKATMLAWPKIAKLIA